MKETWRQQTIRCGALKDHTRTPKAAFEVTALLNCTYRTYTQEPGQIGPCLGPKSVFAYNIAFDRSVVNRIVNIITALLRDCDKLYNHSGS